MKLENQLCFAVYAATNSLTRTYRQPLSEVGLTYTQFLIMLALWEEDKINVKTVAEKLKVDSASIVPALKRMEMKGYIKRDRHFNDDRRTVVIVLTEMGEKLKKELSFIQQNVLSKTGLSDELAMQLKFDLNVLSKNLDMNLHRD